MNNEFLNPRSLLKLCRQLHKNGENWKPFLPFLGLSVVFGVNQKCPKISTNAHCMKLSLCQWNLCVTLFNLDMTLEHDKFCLKIAVELKTYMKYRREKSLSR